MQGRNQGGGSKGSADPPEMSGGVRFADGARFAAGPALTSTMLFNFLFVSPPAPKLLQWVYKGLLRHQTLLRTFLVSIPFWKGPS